jgi:hypothetical protein
MIVVFYYALVETGLLFAWSTMASCPRPVESIIYPTITYSLGCTSLLSIVGIFQAAAVYEEKPPAG